MTKNRRFNVSIKFEGIKLPPFRDILLLSKKCPQGKMGVSKCLNLLSPDNFEMVEINDPVVEAMIVNRNILKRMPVEKVIQILKKEVFPYVDMGEIIRVEFNVNVYIDDIEISFQDD